MGQWSLDCSRASALSGYALLKLGDVAARSEFEHAVKLNSLTLSNMDVRYALPLSRMGLHIC